MRTSDSVASNVGCATIATARSVVGLEVRDRPRIAKALKWGLTVGWLVFSHLPATHILASQRFRNPKAHVSLLDKHAWSEGRVWDSVRGLFVGALGGLGRRVQEVAYRLMGSLYTCLTKEQ